VAAAAAGETRGPARCRATTRSSVTGTGLRLAMLNAHCQCPMPNAQCPNAQYPMPDETLCS
jgi:hypothetical protein